MVRALCLVALVALAAGSAHAQPASKTAEPPPPAGYQPLVDSGLAESAAGRFAEARAKFTQAHALYPNARTLRVIGMVAFELRDYVDAVRHLDAALVEPRRALDAQQRFQVSDLLNQARGFVARYSTSELPQGTTLVVDARPATLEAGGTLLLSIGDHRIVARHQGRTVETTITVRGGEHGSMPLMMDAQDSPAEPAPIAAPAPADGEIHRDLFASEPLPRESEPENKSAFPVGPVVTIGIGVARTAAGAVLLALGLSDVSDVESAPEDTEWSTLESAHDGSALKTGLGAGMLALGGVTATIGVVWLASDGGGESQGVALRVGGGGTW
jgi:tetratricopeptide (TPR) repeat protein